MSILLHVLFGFIFSFMGSITPSMLNMTALKISLEKSIENLSQTNVTLSRKSIEDTVNAIQVFISAKLLQHWNQNDMPPSKATIEIEVHIES